MKNQAGEGGRGRSQAAEQTEQALRLGASLAVGVGGKLTLASAILAGSAPKGVGVIILYWHLVGRYVHNQHPYFLE